MKTKATRSPAGKPPRTRRKGAELAAANGEDGAPPQTVSVDLLTLAEAPRARRIRPLISLEGVPLLPERPPEIQAILHPFSHERATYALGCKALLAIARHKVAPMLAGKRRDAEMMHLAAQILPAEAWAAFLTFFMEECFGIPRRAAIEQVNAAAPAVNRAIARIRRAPGAFLQPTKRGRPGSGLHDALRSLARHLRARHGWDNAEARVAAWASGILDGKPDAATLEREMRGRTREKRRGGK